MGGTDFEQDADKVLSRSWKRELSFDNSDDPPPATHVTLPESSGKLPTFETRLPMQRVSPRETPLPEGYSPLANHAHSLRERKRKRDSERRGTHHDVLVLAFLWSGSVPARDEDTAAGAAPFCVSAFETAMCLYELDLLATRTR